MTEQEIYDTVKKHLLTQNAKSVFDPARIEEGTPCMYRGENGLQCAVGCLIPDDLYHRSMEGASVTLLVTKYSKLRELFGRENTGLVQELQNIHDEAPVNSWKSRLMQAAFNHGLQP